jgi:hypothetical protein
MTPEAAHKTSVEKRYTKRLEQYYNISILLSKNELADLICLLISTKSLKGELAALLNKPRTTADRVDLVDKNIAPTTNANAEDDATAASGSTRKEEC